MGLEAMAPKPNTSRAAPDHPTYPYLLRNLKIDRVNQVWASDITYIPLAQGFAYLVAIIDWHSRLVLAWRLSNTLDTSFCVDALQEALWRYGQPEIFNTDQGAQFTADAFTRVLRDLGVKISMDGKGRCIDNIFVERLWRSLKYEEVYLHAYDSVRDARAGIGRYFKFYNAGVRTRRSATRHPTRSTVASRGLRDVPGNPQLRDEFSTRCESPPWTPLVGSLTRVVGPRRPTPCAATTAKTTTAKNRKMIDPNRSRPPP